MFPFDYPIWGYLLILGAGAVLVVGWSAVSYFAKWAHCRLKGHHRWVQGSDVAYVRNDGSQLIEVWRKCERCQAFEVLEERDQAPPQPRERAETERMRAEAEARKRDRPRLRAEADERRKRQKAEKLARAEEARKAIPELTAKHGDPSSRECGLCGKPGFTYQVDTYKEQTSFSVLCAEHKDYEPRIAGGHTEKPDDPYLHDCYVCDEPGAGTQYWENFYYVIVCSEHLDEPIPAGSESK